VTEYSRAFKDVASKLNKFVKQVSDGWGKVLQKFLRDFWYGMLASQTVLLTGISRGIETKTSEKKTIERFSERLASFLGMDLIWNYHTVIKPEINERTIYIIDNTDATKPYGVKFEELCKVRDGSTGNIEKGYEIVNMVVLTQNHKQPIPVYSHLFSYSEPNYISNNVETQKALDYVRNSFGKGGIKVFDRGYDDINLVRYLLGHNEKFIIRCKDNRTFTFEEKKFHIQDLIKQSAKETTCYLGEHLLTFKSYAVQLHEISLTLVVVTGFGAKPMTLLTNFTCEKELAQTVAKIYVLRWKIEEIHRFEKEVFDLEDFRVRNLKAIRNVVLLTSMLCGFIAMLCERQKHKLFKRLFKMSQTLPKKFSKNHLYFYSIARAIAGLLNAYKTRNHFSSA